jgi:MHS family proline/betaine transporter-like MFS transporter
LTSSENRLHHRVPLGSMLVAAFSTIVEWYDFTLYLYFATTLSHVLFGGGEASLLAALASFAIAYLMRPLGAIVFGHIGDRMGRRFTLLISMIIMTVAMLLLGLLPTYAQIGAASGWLLLLLRCIMGFAVGGEYTGVVAYLLESAPPRRRGLIASLAAAASEVGALLAVGVAALTVHSVSEAQLATWGWRIPFLVGAALALIVWFARASMQESPDFERQRASGTRPENPLWRVLKHHRLGIYRAFAISALGSITYYVGITYAPVFLASAGAMADRDALWLSTLAAIMVIAVTPVTGLLADRFGRKPVLIALAIASAVLPITLFWLMARGAKPDALIGVLILAALAGGVSAVGAVATAEQFPGEGRLSGLAFGATAATAVFGGLTPYLAQLLIDRTGWTLAPGAMIACVALAVLRVFLFAPETAIKAK